MGSTLAVIGGHHRAGYRHGRLDARGEIGTKALIGVIVLVVVGLLIRAGLSKWRASRQARPTEQDPPKIEAKQD